MAWDMQTPHSTCFERCRIVNMKSMNNAQQVRAKLSKGRDSETAKNCLGQYNNAVARHWE